MFDNSLKIIVNFVKSCDLITKSLVVKNFSEFGKSIVICQIFLPKVLIAHCSIS